MGKPYSVDLRERVVGALEDGMSMTVVRRKKRFSIGGFCRPVGKNRNPWGCRLKRSQGDVRPAKQGQAGSGSARCADATLCTGGAEAAASGAPDTGPKTRWCSAMLACRSADVRVVRTAVWKFLDRHDQTYKKRPPMRASKSART